MKENPKIDEEVKSIEGVLGLDLLHFRQLPPNPKKSDIIEALEADAHSIRLQAGEVELKLGALIEKVKYEN